MGTEFTPIFLFILVAILVAIGMITASALLNPGRGRGTPTKDMPYESGMDPIGDARQRFDIRYYLVAIAFLLFDVELLFLYPWVVAQWSAGDAVVVAQVYDDEGTDTFRSVADFRRQGPMPTPAADPEAAEVVPADGAAMASAMGVGIPPEFRTLTFFGALTFIAILTVGFAYDWRKGVFEWR